MFTKQKASVEKHLSEKRIFPFFKILINPTFLENWFIAWNSNGYIFGLRTGIFAWFTEYAGKADFNKCC